MPKYFPYNRDVSIQVSAILQELRYFLYNGDVSVFYKKSVVEVFVLYFLYNGDVLKGLTFCHASGFMCVFDTLDNALNAVSNILQEE